MVALAGWSSSNLRSQMHDSASYAFSSLEKLMRESDDPPYPSRHPQVRVGKRSEPMGYRSETSE